MMIPPGEYRIGPSNGRLILRTFREGMASKVGPDLVIEVTRWQGIVAVPGNGGMPHVAVEADMRSLEILEGTGGVKPLTDKDREEIKRNIADTLMTAQHPQAYFESTSIQVNGDSAVIDGPPGTATRPPEVSARRVRKLRAASVSGALGAL